jgi:hypothetical protein
MVKAEDYLKRIEEQLNQKVEAVKGRVSRLKMAANKGTRLSLEERRNAVRSSVDKLSDLPKTIPALLEILADPAQPEELRISSLASLMSARFIVTTFAPHRAEFIRVLHELLPSAGPDLRDRALEVLAVEKDPEAQALLLKGLQDPSAALVPPASALQYLSYDDHASYTPAVREIVTNTDDPDIKTAGLRLLASDSQSENLFRRLYADRDELSEVRQISASALQLLNPSSFEKIARGIIGDDKEYDEIRAASLGALAHVKDFARTRADAKFVAQVDDLKAKASGFLHGAASQFLKRSE